MLSACVCFGNTHRARRYGARACSSGGVHAIARDSLGTHEEENAGWGKDTAAPASACSYKEGEKREGGGVTLLSAAAADGPAPTFPSRRRGILPRGFLCDNVYGLIP